MRRTPLILFLLALAVPAFAQNPEEVRAVIDAHNADIVRWYATGAIDSLATAFAEDAWQMPPNDEPLKGREAIREFWSQAVQWGRWDFSLEALDVAVSGPMAVERGAYTLAFTPGPGAPFPAFQDRGHYLVHWRLEDDGEWRIVSDAPVSSMPPPDAPGQ